MFTKLLTKQPEQLQVLQIQASIDRNNLGAEIWKGHRTSAHVVWKVRTLEDRDLVFGRDIELAHIWELCTLRQLY